MFSARFLAAASLLSLAALAARPAAAQSTVIGFTSGAYGVTDNAADAGVASYSLGFAFTANSSNYSVTSLGYFNDPSFDPNHPFGTVSLSPEPTGGSYSYNSTHQVGLYQVVPGIGGAAETGTLLTSVIITQSSALDGDFRYAAITPYQLIAGDQYVLAGVSGAKDPYLYNIADDSKTPGGVGMTVDPAITYNEDRYTVSKTLAFADSTDPGSEPGFFGPNFKITKDLPASAAPEPSEWSLLGLAALGLGGLVLRARRRSLRA